MVIGTGGRLAIVLHSHSPWLLGYGTWPVGEEWLRQAWGQAYVPLVRLLRTRAERGERGLLTLGVTPVLAAQWDDPESVREQRRWLADWRTRATGKGIGAAGAGDAIAAADAHRQYRAARAMEKEFDEHWSAGGSAAIRPLIDEGVVEILGGPMTHTFTPHLLTPFAHLALESGLRDHTARLGSRPTGMWAPECAYTPGLEELYQRHGADHFLVDGPTLQHVGASTHRPHRIGDSDVVAFGRDLSLTYRVWSPRRGYPGNEWYQDFHSFDHEWGVRAHRVTSRSSSDKAPYDPRRAAQRVRQDAHDFLQRAGDVISSSTEKNPLVVVAYDTELFGHWWHEGPQFLEAVFDLAPAAGIELTTLRAERDRAGDRPGIHLAAGSWGSGKDFRVWADGEAGQLRDRGTAAQYAVLSYLRDLPANWRASRNETADAIVTELLLGMSSDWAFMITKDSAAQYARSRAEGHFDRLADLLRSAHHDPKVHVSDRRLPFVDARLLPD